MGYLRCVTKPCKRCAFRHARSVADQSVTHVFKKYSKKFVQKCQKHDMPVHGLDEYQDALMRKLLVGKRVSHGKVREYWFLRGPRLFVTVFLGILINIGCNQLVQRAPEIWVSVSSGSIWLIMSTYMLYQRLPDSILSTLMIIGHDHYTEWKLRYFQQP